MLETTYVCALLFHWKGPKGLQFVQEVLKQTDLEDHKKTPEARSIDAEKACSSLEIKLLPDFGYQAEPGLHFVVLAIVHGRLCRRTTTGAVEHSLPE